MFLHMTFLITAPQMLMGGKKALKSKRQVTQPWGKILATFSLMQLLSNLSTVEWTGQQSTETIGSTSNLYSLSLY